MTHKYERQCWNCGSRNMERLTNHVRCRDCGATWNFIPDVHLSPMQSDVEFIQGKTGRVKVEKGRPAGNVPRRATRAREKVIGQKQSNNVGSR